MAGNMRSMGYRHASVYGAVLHGAESQLVQVEAFIEPGKRKGVTITGLPKREVTESQHRIRAACIVSGLDWPKGKITVNLAPASLSKVGSSLDLPIALAILIANGQCVPTSMPRQDSLFVGELQLNGAISKIAGCLCLGGSLPTDSSHFVVPKSNLKESALIRIQKRQARVRGAVDLKEVVFWLEQRCELDMQRNVIKYKAKQVPDDFSDVVGQPVTKRAMEIAACGFHNLLMMGPPGCGKSLLAKCLPSILPELSNTEKVDVTKLWSIRRLLNDGEIIMYRPFRSPHFTTSTSGMVGGGSGQVMPGEVSLSHLGVLFLDELTEFNKNCLEALRQPMEDGIITVSRSGGVQATFPAKFQLIAAMNLCPCGNYGLPSCTCTEHRVERYQSKISGPILDRCDIKVKVGPIGHDERFDSQPAESSRSIKRRVDAGRKRQAERFGDTMKSNSLLTVSELRNGVLGLTEGGKRVLKRLTEDFTMRSLHRTMKMARTIADMDDEEKIQEHHAEEACDLCRAPDWLLTSKLE